MVSKAQGCSKAILHSAVAPLTARSTVADGVGALARGGRTLAERWQHACNTRQHAMHYVLRAPKKATFVAEKTGGVRQRQRAPLQAGAHRCRTRFGLRSSECIVYDGAWGDMGLTEARRTQAVTRARIWRRSWRGGRRGDVCGPCWAEWQRPDGATCEAVCGVLPFAVRGWLPGVRGAGWGGEYGPVGVDGTFTTEACGWARLGGCAVQLPPIGVGLALVAPLNLAGGPDRPSHG